MIWDRVVSAFVSICIMLTVSHGMDGKTADTSTSTNTKTLALSKHRFNLLNQLTLKQEYLCLGDTLYPELMNEPGFAELRTRVLKFHPELFFSVPSSSLTFGNLISFSFPFIHDKETFAAVRDALRQYGVDRFYDQMRQAGVFAGGKITSEPKPFNPFACYVQGKKTPAYSPTLLSEYGLADCEDKFMVALNRKENDERWADPAHKTTASMGPRHQFLVLRDPAWTSFNVLTIGLNGDSKSFLAAIDLLVTMKAVALAYCKARGWSDQIGLFFHVHPFNSIQTLHLHMLDLDQTGPAFEYFSYKNLSIDDVILQLMDELVGA